MTELVSILMPAHNAQRYVAEAVRSVLAQTYAHFELLAIDDGSTDRTGEILRSFAEQDVRVKVIAHENRGMGRALNGAMERARGEWLFRMDADDVMLPHRIERQLAFLAENPDLVVASSLVQYIDQNGAPLGRSKCEYTSREKMAQGIREGWVVGFHHPAVAMKKSVIQEIGGYREQFWPADDLDLWNRVAQKHGGLLVQPEYLLEYRIHGSSVSVAKSKLATQKIEWVGACLQARRTSQPEPTWEAFLAARQSLPWPHRLNHHRRDWARMLYKSAAMHFSCRSYAWFASTLAAAACLEPSYVLPRVIARGG